MEPDADRPDPVARLDQLGATLSGFARPFGEYFEALLVIGFDRSEAFELTRDAHAAWLEAVLEED